MFQHKSNDGNCFLVGVVNSQTSQDKQSHTPLRYKECGQSPYLVVVKYFKKILPSVDSQNMSQMSRVGPHGPSLTQFLQHEATESVATPFPCENFYEISPRSRRDLGENRDRSEIWKSRQANTRRDVAARSRRDTEISAAKTGRDREVISRRDMDISAGSFAARPRWESCRDLRRETKFLAVKILLLSRREAKFSVAKLGSMRTIFTFTLTINQTTRR